MRCSGDAMAFPSHWHVAAAGYVAVEADYRDYVFVADHRLDFEYSSPARSLYESLSVQSALT